MSERSNDIRKEILMQLYALRPLSITPKRIAKDAKKQNYDYSEHEIKSELQFLEDEKLVIGEREPGTTGKVYRIHALGVTTYEEKYAA
jgi:DNA-binding PadR family transcriptional regulator